MQVVSASFQSPSFSSGERDLEVSGRFSHDFGAMIRFDELCLENQVSGELSHEFGGKMKLEELGFENQPRSEELEAERGGEEGEMEEEEEEEEFSFVCLNPDGSPISADDAFCNGQIRPVFPLFNQDLLSADGKDGVSSSIDGARPPLRKIFIEGRDSTSVESDPEGPYCEWTGRTVEEASKCKKSNSTGFSKIWRFRDLVHRSNSDGKDAFVFLNHPPPAKFAVEKTEKIEKEKKKEEIKGKAKKVKGNKPTPSAAEKHFAKGRAIREGAKRKSYLPYRQNMFGFFTSVNGFSKNIHPY